MSSVKMLVSAIHRRLSNGDVTDDSRFTYRELRLHVRSQIGVALKRNFYEALNADDFRYGDDSVTTTYTDVPVLTEQRTGLKYLEIPAQTVSLGTMRGIDVHDSNPISKYNTTFIPVRNEEVFVGSLQPNIPCIVEYFRKGTKLYFKGVVDQEALDVTQKYSLPTNDDVELNLPPEYEDLVIAGVLELLAPKLANRDTQNDGTPED